MVFGQPMDIGSQQRLGRDALFVGRFRKVVRDDSPVRVASPGGLRLAARPTVVTDE